MKKIDSTPTSAFKNRYFWEYCTITIIPPVVILNIPVPLINSNLFVLIIVFWIVLFTVISRIRTELWTLQDLGLQRNIFKYWPQYLLVTILGSVVLSIYFFCTNCFPPDIKKYDTSTLFWYSGMGSVMQELLYRSYLILLGFMVFPQKPRLNFCLNVLLFTGMHYIFPNGIEKMIFVLPGAITFTWMYTRYRNIVLVSCVHIVFNTLSVLGGVFR